MYRERTKRDAVGLVATAAATKGVILAAVQGRIQPLVHAKQPAVILLTSVRP